MKRTLATLAINIGSGLSALSLGLVLTRDAGEMMPLALALGVVLFTGGILGRRASRP